MPGQTQRRQPASPPTKARHARGGAMTNEKLPPIQNRIITAATGIMADHEPLIEYQHSLFCQGALPRSRPESRVFERSYRQGSIRIEAGALWNGKTWVEQPVPAGPKPRLALIELVASFRSRRSFSHGPRCRATASYESGAVRKMVGFRGRVGGGNARDRRVFWPVHS